MRFLVVYKDYVPDARGLLAELDVQGVQILPCGPEKKPQGETARVLAHTPGSEVAFVGVNKKYRQVVGTAYDCNEAVSVASVKGGRVQLKGWLRPVTEAAPEWLKPSQVFIQAVAGEQRLVLADGALTQADRITERRVPFANKAARALAAYAAALGSAPGGLTQFFKERGVNFAPNGAIEVTYKLYREGVPALTTTSEWHLKEGDRTTADDAARVYFHNIAGVVVVARCGPHPADDFEIWVTR